MFNVKWGAVLGGVAFVLALILSLLFGKVLFLTALFRALIFAVAFFIIGTGAWVLISSFIPELLTSDAREDMGDIFSSREAPGSRVNITVGGASGAALPDTGGGMSGVDEVGNIADLVSGKIKPSAMPAAMPSTLSGAKDMDQMRPSGYTDNEGGSGSSDIFSISDSGPEGFSPDFSAFTGGAFGDTGDLSGSSSADGADKADDGNVFGDFGGFGGGGDSEPSGGASSGAMAAGGLTDSAGVTGGKAADSLGIFDDGDIFSSASIYSSGGTFGSEAAEDSDESDRKSIGNKPQEFEGDFNPKEIAMGLRTVLDKDKKG